MDIIRIRLCVVAIRVNVSFGLGLGVFVRFGSWPRLMACCGPVCIEIERR